MKYLLNIPNISSKEHNYVNDVLKKNWLSTNGKHNTIAQKKFIFDYEKLINKVINLSI